MNEADFYEYDTLNVQVKKERQTLTDECYKTLGWEKVSEEEDKMYADTNELKFVRPHKLKNKDELQLLQVHLEYELNNLGKLEQTKFLKTLLLASIGSLLFIFFACAGIVGVVRSFNSAIRVLCWILICVSIAVAIITIVSSKNTHSKEKLKFDKQKADTHKKIDEICVRAKNLRGGSNEN